ncbi:PAS domain-containing hybrid sensor histidine kinase/response regulator [Desulfopila inferna]|uniref:PAS domain-containing hybrid sensor histidine kinase/response regulator n=1 Tax=Desulfopila inferna TaxID=468528 RepID=UPI001966B5AE|nr:PAS domain S-box protein [Desulfopila inferna]MBM9604198.1 PAS domain S-box protein [Desulfopila inferna]
MSSDEDKKIAELLEDIHSLRRKIAKIQTLFPVIITSLKSGSILYINDFASRFFGVSAEEAEGMCAKKFWPDLYKRRSFIRAVQQEGQVTDYETSLVNNAMEKRYVLLSANLVTHQEQEAIYMVFTDITQKKKAEKALKKSRERHRNLSNLMTLMSDTVSDLIWAKDLDDRYLFANKAICDKLLMCTPDENPLGENDLFFAQRERERGHNHTFGEICIDSDKVVKKSRKPQKFLEDGLVRGKYLALKVHKAPMFDEKGKLIGTVGTGRDVTLDNIIQNDLRKSEAMYRLLADNVRDVIWTTNDQLDITYVTPSIENLMGFTPEEFVRLAKEEQLTPHFRHQYRLVTRLLLKEAKKQEPITRLWEFEWYHKNGHRIWVETSTSAVYTAEGKFDGFVCVTRETTKKVLAQNDLEKAKEEALLASNAKSEFLANMSHEIRTPMNGVLGMMQLLQKTPLSSEQKSYVDTALSSGKSLLKIISDILDFSKIEAGKIDLEDNTFSLQAVIQSIAASFENLIDHKHVSLITEIDQSLPTHVIGDETRLRQILFNLIGNAAKFTEKGTISVHVASEGCYENKIKLVFEIRDTGVGVPADKIDTLFEPFVQVDGSFRRKYTGTGLGLSIVKQLVQLMGGEVEIHSVRGQGTMIIFSVLVKSARSADCPEIPSIAAERPAVHNRRVLVVEDENINALVITTMLKKLGHFPTLVNNGHKALELLKYMQFHCILMDIQMPQLDGIETARAIRKSTSGNCRDVPIIALTAHAMKGDRERFLDAGMNDYITKPVNMTDLITVLQNNSMVAEPSN